MAETVGQEALAVQDHADRPAREVAATAASAATLVASAVRPGQHLEAHRTAAATDMLIEAGRGRRCRV